MSRPETLPLRAQLALTLYQAEVGTYGSLRLIDSVWPCWVVSHVQHGRVLTRTRGEEAWADSGDVMVHPPHLPFSELAEGPGSHQYLMFDLAQPPQLDLLRLHPVSPVVRLADQDAFSHTFERLRDACRRPCTPERDLRVFARTVELIGQVIESWRQSGAVSRSAALKTPSDRFLDLIAYMNAHLDQKLTRDELAARVFLHPGYFDRIFRQAYGIAPTQMLRDLRLARARQLLEATSDSLDSIAAACGLGDAAAFSRAFRARYALPPGQYRQSVQAAKHSAIYPAQSNQVVESAIPSNPTKESDIRP